MHLRFVEIFCDVAQRCSFSKGAAAQNVSQSSASQAVHLLEKRLGTRLFDRSTRPLKLTPAGQLYYDGCREMLKRFRSIEDSIQRIHDRVAGTVRVAAIYSVGLMQLEQSVQRFSERYPDVRLRVEYLHPNQVYEKVQNDEADLGLVSFPRSNGEIASIDWQKQAMVLVVPPSHRLAGSPGISMRDINGDDFVAFTQDLTIRREMDRWLRAHEVAVRVVHEFDNIETIKKAVEIGAGAALLPEPTVWREISTNSLKAIPILDANLFRPLGIVHQRHKQPANAVQKFIELLQEDAASASSVRVDASGSSRVTSGPRSKSTGGARTDVRAASRRKKRAGV
jgi:DNA-binding transcriptional LysR family regulator